MRNRILRLLMKLRTYWKNWLGIKVSIKVRSNKLLRHQEITNLIRVSFPPHIIHRKVITVVVGEGLLRENFLTYLLKVLYYLIMRSRLLHIIVIILLLI